jgi:hypothetical protein
MYVQEKEIGHYSYSKHCYLVLVAVEAVSAPVASRPSAAAAGKGDAWWARAVTHALDTAVLNLWARLS